MKTSEEYQEEIKREIAESSIVLFAKGTKDGPRCGFSAQVIKILNSYQQDFSVINLLEDFSKKEELKKFSNWPTIPQLYVNQKFIGGCDIVSELHEAHELAEILSANT